MTSLLLHGAFVAHAARRPGAPALICRDHVFSYGDLATRALRLAARLRALGAQRGQLAAIAVEPGWQQVVAVLGVLHAGAGYAPVDAGVAARLVVTELADDDAAPGAPPEGATIAPPAAGDVACVVRSRTSRGALVGTRLDHRTAVAIIRDIDGRTHAGPEDCFLAASPLGDLFAVHDLFGGLSAGATVVVPAADEVHSPRALLELIEDYGVTVCSVSPELAHQLVEEAAAVHAGSLDSLRLIVLGGDAIAAELPARIRWCAPRAQIVRLWEGAPAARAMQSPVGRGERATWTP